MEAIAKKLFGIETIADKAIKGRMINNAVKAGKDAAEQVYGGFEMMKLYRENEQLKGQNAMFSKKHNAIRKDSMSLENVQEMLIDFADSRVANTNYFSELDRRKDTMEFLKEWRKNNDC